MSLLKPVSRPGVLALPVNEYLFWSNSRDAMGIAKSKSGYTLWFAYRLHPEAPGEDYQPHLGRLAPPYCWQDLEEFTDLEEACQAVDHAVEDDSWNGIRALAHQTGGLVSHLAEARALYAQAVSQR